MPPRGCSGIGRQRLLGMSEPKAGRASDDAHATQEMATAQTLVPPSGDRLRVRMVWIHGFTTAFDCRVGRIRSRPGGAVEASPLLKWGRFDHTQEQRRESPVLSIQSLDDLVDCLDITR